MAKLGSLYYELFLKDLTDQDLQAIEKKLKNLDIELDTKKLTESLKKSVESYKGKDLALGVKTQYLHDAIRAALKQPEFPIKVTVNKAEAQDAVREALRRAGLQHGFTASDKRQYDAETKRLAVMQVAQARAAASNALAQQRLARAHNTASSAADGHTKATVSLNSALKGNLTITKELGGAIGAAYSVVALKNFMTKVVEIGGELEQQKLAMKAILGDEGMANTISSQINTLAVKSPFGIMELNQYAKQLTAFQIPYNELYDTMKRMADISAATGTEMGRIILAFGQVRAAKFLKGTELRQFTEANIPLIDMLADRFTKLKGEIVSAGDIMDMISNKEVSFEDVKAVLWELTGEGGRFYNMQEVLSESTKAKWKNLADAIDLMFADIADSTSGTLKSVAEALTTLTDNWDILAAAIASGTVAFGAAKVYSTVFARTLDASGRSALQAAANTALLERRNLNLAKVYRTLTAEEQSTLSTRIIGYGTQKRLLNSLNSAQFQQLALSGKISKEEWNRMIALNRLSEVQKKILIHNGVLTQAEMSNIKVLSKWRGAWLGVGNAMRSVGRSMLALVANPVTAMMAAVGTIMSLWQRHSEEMKKAEEIGDDLFTKANEGANNLKQALDTIKPAEGLSDIDLVQGIEKMEQAIKDYSPTPINDINEALSTQDGHLLTLAERYEALRKKLGEIKDAFDGIQFNKVNKAIENALSDTSEGIAFDGLEKNLKDYENAKSILDKHIRDYSVEHKEDLHEVVESASKQSEAYRNAIQSMSTDAQKFYELIINGAKYGKDLDEQLNNIINKATHGGFWQNAGEGLSNVDLRDTGERVNAAYDEIENDAKLFKQRFYESLEQMGIDVQSLSAEQLSIALNAMLDKFEIKEETKMMFAKELEELFKVTLIDDKVTPIFAEKFRKISNASSKEAVQEAMIIWQTEGWDKLSQTQKDLLEDIFNQAKTQSKANIEAIVGDMSTYLAAHPGQWNVVVNMVTSQMQKEMPDWTRNAISSRGGVSNVSKAAFDYLKTWGAEGSQYGARNAAQQALQGAENELKAYVAEADKLTPEYKKALQKKKDVQEAINYLGWGDISIKDQKSNKHPKSKTGGAQKDALAEQLKQRFKDIKDAYAMFKEWAKLEGKEAAFKRVGESGLFATLAPDKLPQTVDEYLALIDNLEKELKAAGIKGKSQRESLANELIKERLGINKDTFKEQLQLALDKVSKEAERQLADWNLFDKIRKATGNEKLAMSIAFGMNADATKDYPTLVKKQFAKIAKEVKGIDLTFDNTTLEQAKNLGDEIAKSYQDTASKLEKYAREQKDAIADILNEYQSLQDKLTKIDADRDRKIKVIRQSDMSAPEKAKFIQRVNVEADYQKFTQSNEYLQFFAGIYALTEQEATRIGDLIEQNLNMRLQSGTISAEDYYKEIERIRQQLNKLRNVKSDAMTFLTGGVKGLAQKRQEANDAKRLETIQKIQALEEELAEAEANAGDFRDAQAQGRVLQAKLALANAKKELDIQDRIREKLIQNQKQWQNILDVANIASGIASGMSDAFNSIKDMADAFGADTESGVWEDIGAFLDTFSAVTGGIQKTIQSAMSGDVGGVIGGVVSTITTPFTIWSKLHDKKLQKLIDRSKEAAQIMQNQYDILEKRMANFLGNAAGMNTGVLGGAYGKQRQLMQNQMKELEKQRQAEIDKKKTDNSVVEDYNKQIEEMRISIHEFALEAAKELYDIDLNGWADQLGDALVDAFAKGEDAAAAFDKTVGDILRDITKKMISQDILAPMFADLRNFLFGENGMSGAFGSDFKLDASELAAMKNYLDKIKNEGIPAAEELFDAINKATGGMLDDTEKAKSGLSAGIQAMTEDTGDLVASYLNGIRGDVSVQTHVLWPKLLDDMLPQMNVIAQSQLDAQRQIAENTLRNAVAAEAIVKSNDDISRLLTRVTQGGAKFYIH